MSQSAADLKVHLKEILETIPDAIVAINDEGIVQLFNLAAEPLFQYSAEEVIGLHIGLLLPELNARTSITPNCTEMLEAASQNGKRFPVEFSAGEINIAGRKLLACVVRDVSDRIRAEAAAREARDQLVQAEKLASLGELVAGIAHEINTPLGISVTASTYLLEQYQLVNQQYQENQLKKKNLENFFTTCEQSATILMGNLQRASELIRSFKQIAVDQSSNAPRRINLQDYLSDLLLSLRPQLKNRAIAVNVDCPCELEIMTYPGAVSQVLTNLILNSLTHAFEEEDSGVVDIRVRAEKEDISLIYRDDGKGIAENAIPRIFEPFFTTRRSSGSSGLGLHIVYNLVTQTLGGSMRVNSVLEEETVFYIRFPRELETADHV
jgi:PAS domain S-box-containing protein